MGTTDTGIDLEQRLKLLEETREVSFDKLFTPAFMQEFTKHASFEAFLEASPFETRTTHDILAIPDPDWNEYVRKETSFPSWDDMHAQAAAILTDRLLDECLR